MIKNGRKTFHIETRPFHSEISGTSRDLVNHSVLSKVGLSSKFLKDMIPNGNFNKLRICPAPKTQMTHMFLLRIGAQIAETMLDFASVGPN